MLHRPYRFAAALVFSLAVLITGCRSARSDAQPPSAPAEAVENTIRSGGMERTFDLYRPSGLNGPAPLVIMLHGGGGNSENGARMSGFNALADREGFVVAYPDGSGRRRLLTWNAGHCCAYAMQEGIDDVQFLSDLIDDLVKRGIASQRRIYVTGMSNGAMMSFRAGRELSHKVAAIAPVVGAMFGDEPAAASPVAALIITGGKDANVPWKGGYGDLPRWRKSPADAPYAPAAAAFDYWARVNDCAARSVTRSSAIHQQEDGERCRAPVTWVHLHDSGHAWPGGERGSKRGDKPVTVYDASEAIWAFFEDQRLAR